MKGILSFFVAAALLAGCASQSIAPPSASDSARYAAYSRPGRGAIVGRASARSWTGDVKYAAGCEIILVPNTPYFAEMVEKHLTPERIASLEPSARACVRTAAAHSLGAFEFHDLPAGSYVAFVEMSWENASSAPSYGTNVDFHNTRIKKTLSAVVDIREGETKTVALE